MKWRSICYFGFCLPPLPQGAENRSSTRIEQAGSSDAPKFIVGAFALGGGRFNCTLTRLPKPIAAMNSLQLFFQLRRKRQQIMDVVHCIFQHPCRQRSQRPICLLRMFVKLHIEETLHQRTETEFADPK